MPPANARTADETRSPATIAPRRRSFALPSLELAYARAQPLQLLEIDVFLAHEVLREGFGRVIEEPSHELFQSAAARRVSRDERHVDVRLALFAIVHVLLLVKDAEHGQYRGVGG